MASPWLSIPLSDYEGHMSAPEVAQLAVLSELFAEVLDRCHPASVAILGVAGGNGLEHVDPGITTRIVGVDVNPVYLEAVRTRFPRQTNLQLHCVDLAAEHCDLPPAELVYAALLFEHAGIGRCLENAVSLVDTGGALSVVLQLPTESGENVGASPFPSLQKLKDHFALIDPQEFSETLAQRGFRLEYQTTRTLPVGKRFWLGIFRNGPRDARL